VDKIPPLGKQDAFTDLEEPGVLILRLPPRRPNRIEIHPGGTTLFIAQLKKRRVLHLTIRTMNSEGNRDPFFEKHRARELVARAIQFFEKEWGELKGFEFDWRRPKRWHRSDNYTAYIRARNLLQIEKGLPRREARQEAIMATWTYDVASRHGFTEMPRKIIEIGEDPDNPSRVHGILWRKSNKKTSSRDTR
jgi:hypothetical protein